MSDKIRVVGCVCDEVHHVASFDTQKEVDAFCAGWDTATDGVGGDVSSYAVSLEDYEDYFGKGMPCEDEPELAKKVKALLNGGPLLPTW